MVGGASNLYARPRPCLEGLLYMSTVLHGETHLTVTCINQWSARNLRDKDSPLEEPTVYTLGVWKTTLREQCSISLTGSGGKFRSEEQVVQFYCILSVTFTSVSFSLGEFILVDLLSLKNNIQLYIEKKIE